MDVSDSRTNLMPLVSRVVKKDVHDQATKFLNYSTIFNKALSVISLFQNFDYLLKF